MINKEANSMEAKVVKKKPNVKLMDFTMKCSTNTTVNLINKNKNKNNNNNNNKTNKQKYHR